MKHPRINQALCIAWMAIFGTLADIIIWIRNCIGTCLAWLFKGAIWTGCKIYYYISGDWKGRR